MDINENHGQLNVNCDVYNEELRMPLRPDAILRDCPNCFTQNTIDSTVCSNRNCNTDYARHRDRLVLEELERLIREKEHAQLAWMGFAFTVFLLGAIPIALWQTVQAIAPFFIGVVMCVVSPYGKELEHLEAARNEISVKLWI